MTGAPCLPGHPGLGQFNRLTRHFDLGEPPFFGQIFCRMPITIARRKIHPAINPGRVFAQGLLDDTHRLDKIAPVHRAQHAQATDAVTDRNLIRSLLLILGLHQLVDGQSRFGQALLDPGERQGQGRATAFQPARQLSDKSAGHRRIRVRHVGNHQNQAFCIIFRRLGHQVGPPAGHAALNPARSNQYRNPAQVLDHRQPQHDRNRPQFANFQGRDGLIGGNKAAERFVINPSIAMRHGFQRNVVNPWPAG